ncbi:MAG: GNVR domain-containing protein [Pseudomonadales bacterium]
MNEIFELIIQYVRSAWRFRWWAAGVAWLLCLLGWTVVSLQPDVYEASSRVYVDTSSDLRRLLQDQIVESGVEDQLSLVRQVMLGRPQLSEVAAKTGLSREARTDADKARVIDSLSQQIFIQGGNVDNRGRRDNMYSITYQHSDRLIALGVVETLLDTFVESSLAAKRTSSEAAGRFLRDQIDDYEQRLRIAEERLAEFNRKHFDRLPSMQGGYFQRLQSATEELDSARQQLRLAESRLERVDQQIRGEAPQVTVAGEVDPESLEGRILSNQARLDELRLRFTENHPDVIAARENIAQLQRRQREAAEQIRDGGAVVAGANNPVFQALQISRHEIETEIASLQAEVADRAARVARLRGLINEMPEVEAELARLNRDYDVIHAHYQSLLNSLEREQLTREVFQSEQIDFRIIDPPAAGLNPVAPKRMILLLLVFMAGIGGAGALAFVLSQIKPIYQVPSDLFQMSDLPVLGSVGRYLSSEDRRRRNFEYIGFTASFALLCVTFVGVVLFEVVGPGLRGIL